jgi:hypothetical protein
MQFGRTLALVSVLFLASTAPSFAGPRVHRGPTSPKLFKERQSKGHSKSASLHGIDPARATQIQAALIKSGYLTGAPSGQWDASTEAAMQKLQADNGWQTKLVPDARAIIKLGLGPSSDEPGSLNASAATETGPSEVAAPEVNAGSNPNK